MKSKFDLDKRRSDSSDRGTRPNGGGNRNNGPRPQGNSANFNPGATVNNG